jgi:hypothetical protein
MKVRVIICSAASALALAFAAPAAQANTFFPDKPADYFPDNPLPSLPSSFQIQKSNSNLSAGVGSVNVDLNGTVPTPSYNVLAGGFNVKVGTDQFIAWCLDILDIISLPSNYSVNNLNPFSGGTPINNGPILSPDRRADIQALFDSGYNTFLNAISSGANNSQSAGFQLALWEIVNETAGSYSLTAGNFTAANNNADRVAANTAANSYLAGMVSYQGPKLFNVSYLQAVTANNQNLVTVSPVPLPAAGLMLLTALGGVAAAYRRKQRKAV